VTWFANIRRPILARQTQANPNGGSLQASLLFSHGAELRRVEHAWMTAFSPKEFSASLLNYYINYLP
jgi:hypothetical protein